MKTLLPLIAAVSLLSACGVEQTATTPDELSTDSSELNTKGKFETFVGKDGQTYFHLLAGNGQKVLASQGYASTSGALDGIASVQANGANELRYLLRTASNGASYFVLTAANGAIIGTSEMYVSESNANRGLATVIKVVKATVETGAAQTQSDARFQTFKGLDGKYYFHVKAKNGEIVLQSQAYTTKASANAGVTSVQTNGVLASRYSVVAAADGSSYFVLKAANGQVIANGETYASKSNTDRAVAACVTLLSGTVLR